MYFTAKRDAELAKAELEQALDDAARDAEATTEAHKAQLAALRRAAANKAERADEESQTWGEKFRSKTLQAEAATARNHKLEAKLQQASRAIDKYRSECTSAKAKASAMSVEWKEQECALNQTIQRLTCDLEGVRAVVARQQCAAAERAEEVQSLQREKTMNEQTASERERSLRAELSKVAEDLKQSQERCDSQLAAANAAAASARKDAEQANERIRQLESAAMTSSRQNSQAIASLQRRLEAAESTQTHKGIEGDTALQAGMCIISQEEVDRLQAGQQSLRSQLCQSSAELDGANTELRGLREQCSALKQHEAHLTGCLSQAQEKIESLETQLSSSQDRCRQLELQQSTQEAALHDAQQLSDDLQLQVQRLLTEKEDSRVRQQQAIQALEAQIRNVANTRAADLSRAQTELDQTKQHLVASRKKAAAYKQKLLTLWKRFQDLQESFVVQESAHRVGVLQYKERVDRLRRQVRGESHHAELEASRGYLGIEGTK